MDSADHGTDRHATTEQLRSAIEALSDEEYARLRRAGEPLLFGTEYKNPLELVNEAMVRAMLGARGEVGRRWPIHVPFTTFLYMTMCSLANASVEAPIQADTDYLEELVPEGMSAQDFAIAPLWAPSTEAVCVDEETRAAATQEAAAVLAAVENHFAKDDEVLMLVLRLREGQRPRQIQAEEGMSKKTYATVRRRLRRGLAKLGFTGKSP